MKPALRSAFLLLKDDASPFLPNREGKTPLLLLFESAANLSTNQLAEIRAILEFVLEKGVKLDSADKQGNNVLHLLVKNAGEPLLLELLGNIIPQDSKLLNELNAEGLSPFHIAVNRELKSTVVALLSYAPSLITCKGAVNTCTNSEITQLLQEYITTCEANGQRIIPSKFYCENAIPRRPPGLLARCRILQIPYPADHVEVKVLATILDQTLVTKLNVHMQVKQAIAKLREQEALSRISEKDLSLFIPAKISNSSTPGQNVLSSPLNTSSPGISRKFSDTSPIWLDPELCLWHYGISNQDLISLKRAEKDVEDFIWLKIMVRVQNELQQKIIRVERGITVRELSDCIHKVFSRYSNKFMGLYLHDEFHAGHWMTEESQPIEYYSLRNMDIIEFRETPVYKVGFIDSQDEIACSKETPVKEILMMIIFWLSDSVDPSSIGLVFFRKSQTQEKTHEPIWLDPNTPFGQYDLVASDRLHLMSVYQQPDSKLLATLIVHSDPTSPSKKSSKFQTGPCAEVPLLGGEEIRGYQANCRYLAVGQFPQDGYIFVTNAHILFGRVGRGYIDFSVRISLATIARVDKPVPLDKNFLDIYCKDLRTVRFSFLGNNAAQDRKELFDLIQNSAFPDFYELFAFYYQPKYEPHSGWQYYSVQSEFARMKVSPKLWRISNINSEYSYCSSYPSKLIVPANISDSQLRDVFSFRSKGRISILTYFHTNTATITRCSQPRVGVTNARSEADEFLTNAIREANQTNSETLYLFDARPKANAIANQAIGMGYEKISASSYKQCKLEFLSIDNIHVMREAFYRIQRLCESTHKDDRNFYTSLDATHWLTTIKLLLNCSVKIAKIIDQEGCSVLLHCSDGWDRTAQLASLAQIFLSPFFRTIKGLQVLIEKDWLSVGHKFAVRCGHADSNFNDDQRSPIFLQFIDCVWQCVQQFPCLFEFTEDLLVFIMDHVYSCQFGTFLLNNERERKQANLEEITVSLWSEIDHQRSKFLNPFYLPGVGAIYPSTYFEDIHLWKSYYLRHCRTPNPFQGVSVHLRALQLLAVNENLTTQIEGYKSTIEALQAQLNALQATSDNSQTPIESANPSEFSVELELVSESNAVVQESDLTVDIPQPTNEELPSI